VLNLRFWCGGWEEGSMENGNGILSTKRMFNLKSKSKKWFKKLVATLVDWETMKATMLLKYGTIDKKEVKAKLDLIK
jgi:hypothetical protein